MSRLLSWMHLGLYCSTCLLHLAQGQSQHLQDKRARSDANKKDKSAYSTKPLLAVASLTALMRGRYARRCSFWGLSQGRSIHMHTEAGALLQARLSHRPCRTHSQAVGKSRLIQSQPAEDPEKLLRREARYLVQRNFHQFPFNWNFN